MQKYYIASFGLKIYEYVVEVGVILWGLEPEIRAQSNFCHRKSGPEGSSRWE
jgi:hypothetical protein